jgi:hypothetical protein
VAVGRWVVADFQLERGRESAVADRVRRLFHESGRFVDFSFEAGNNHGQVGENFGLPERERVDALMLVGAVARRRRGVGIDARNGNALRWVAHRAKENDLHALRERVPFAGLAGASRRERNPVRDKAGIVGVVGIAHGNPAGWRVAHEVNVEHGTLADHVHDEAAQFVGVHAAHVAGRARVASRAVCHESWYRSRSSDIAVDARIPEAQSTVDRSEANKPSSVIRVS